MPKRGKIVEIIGGAETTAALRAISADVGADLEAIALAAAEVVRQGAANRAPRRSGDLAANMTQEILEKSEMNVVVAVGPDEKQFYGLYLELGTGPADISPDVRQALKLEDGSLVAHARTRGLPPQPFLRPALEEKQDAAVGAAIAKLNQVLK